MKSLFILPDHFPHSGACSSLLLKMLTEGDLAEKSGQIHVLVPRYTKEEPALEMVGNVTIHRALMPSFLPAAELKKMKSRPDILFRGFIAKLWERKVIRRFRKDRFLQGCFTKEIRRSIERLHREENFQVLIPVAGSYEMAAAAMTVAKKEKIGLLVYQVDPCSTNISYSEASRISRERFEDAMYRNADGVITTPIILAERQAAGKPDLEKGTAMEFPNVSVAAISPVVRESSDKTICVFAGRVYQGIRNPAYTVKLFTQLVDRGIELHMFGVTKEELSDFNIEESLAEKIFCHGLCSLAQVQEKLRRADVVVNIGNIMTNQVPSKIFEYISSCKPILNIAANSDCPSIPYLQKYPMALTLTEDEESIEKNADLLAEFVAENAGKMADQQKVLDTFRECTAVYCAEVIASEIKKISIKNGG